MTDFEPGWPCAPAQTGAPSVADRLSDPSGDDLLPQVLSLTPRGPAWGTDEAGDGQGASPLMQLFWGAIAAWNAASYVADFTLALQALPSAITWSLGDWEAELGLPDPCVGEPPDTAGRVMAVRSKYAALGGQSPDYYVCLAASLGATICLVEEFQSCRIGSRIGTRGAVPAQSARIGDLVGERLAVWGLPGLDTRARLYGPAWDFAFRVHTDKTAVAFARIGARIGAPLASWGNPVLECAIRRARPAQTAVLFAYDGCTDYLLNDDGQPMLNDDGQHLLAI